MANETDDLIRLRTKLLEFQKQGALSSPEAFGTYQQSILQVFQEAERRKHTCMAQAASFRQQAAAAEAQAHAFSTVGSILYSIVDGYVSAEHKRLAEEAERKKEAEGTLPAVSASGEVYEPRGRGKRGK